MAEIFLEFDCPITFFIITGLVDKMLWPWDAKVSWMINYSRKAVLQFELEDECVTVDISDAERRRLARQRLRDILKEMDAELVSDLLNRFSQATGVPVPETIPGEYQPLVWDTARELEAKGVRFAPHSMTHRILSKLRKASVETEIRGSWETMCPQSSGMSPIRSAPISLKASTEAVASISPARSTAYRKK